MDHVSKSSKDRLRVVLRAVGDSIDFGDDLDGYRVDRLPILIAHRGRCRLHRKFSHSNQDRTDLVESTFSRLDHVGPLLGVSRSHNQASNFGAEPVQSSWTALVLVISMAGPGTHRADVGLPGTGFSNLDS